MARAAIIAVVLSLLSPCVHAQQQPPQPSATAQFVGQVSTLLATTLDERDVCRAQLAAQAQKPPAAPAPTPEAPK